MKKPFSVLLIFVFLLTAVPVCASASISGVTGDCTWTQIGNHLIISGNGRMADYDNYATDGPGYAPWGWYITSVTIEEGVTHIGNYAFAERESLSTVEIADSVESIGAFAFAFDYDLRYVPIPSGVKTIGERAFFGSPIQEATIPSGITVIESGLFDSTALTSIVIPEGVTTIGDGAFCDCALLTTITIPDSVTSVGYIAFMGCNELTTVYYGGGDAEWNAIAMGEYNDYLLEATRISIHAYDNACDSDCNDCGKVRVPPHAYTNSCDADCNLCGVERQIQHSYDNDCDGTCNVCGFGRKPADHVYSQECDPTCDVCGAIRQGGTHTYDNSCDSTCNICGDRRTAYCTFSSECDEICNVCGRIREYTHYDHYYDNACDSDCNGCGSTREVEGHRFGGPCDGLCETCGLERLAGEHIYRDACDMDCDVCSTQRTAPHNYSGDCVEYCSLCGHYRGALSSHLYDNDYDNTCNVCGAIRQVEMKVLNFAGNSFSEDVSGLAFRFDVAIKGMTADGYVADYTNATVGTVKLISMGAVLTRNGSSTYLENVDDINVIGIAARYVLDVQDNLASFAVRVMEIPERDYDTVITARPYYIYENNEGVRTVVYGEECRCSVNDVLA